MEKPQALVLLLAITILASTAHAQFDWAEGLNDFFADFSRPNCSHEGEAADRPCCSGLQEQYDGYSGETICTEYSETQIIQQPTQNTPAQVGYPESEPVCYSDDYCQYVKGEEWKCNFGNNRCYYDGTSIDATLIQPGLKPTYYPVGDVQSTDQATTIDETRIEQQGTLEEYRVLDKNVFGCTNNNQCRNKFGPEWFCTEYKCTTQDCFSDSDCKKYGTGWICDTRQKRCLITLSGRNALQNIRKGVDIVFVPLGYVAGQDKEFRDGALLSLDNFKRLIPNACSISSVAFIAAGNCQASCKGYCCLLEAERCAIDNGYIFAKKIVGVIKPTEKIDSGGCAYRPGIISTFVNPLQYMGEVQKVNFAGLLVLSHEIGHNFGLCHVDSDIGKELCGEIENACGFGCPNKLDCFVSFTNPTDDIMSYCYQKKSFGPAGYSYLNTICNRLAAAQPSQQVLAAYITVSRDGTATLNSAHVGEASLDEEDEQGDYELEAYDDGREIASEDFNVQFSLHADIVNEDGTMNSEHVELNEVSAIVELPYSPDIDEIKIEHNGQVLVAKDLSEIAAGGSMFAQTSDGNTQITTLPEDIAENQGITITNVAYEQKEENLVYNVEGTKTELFLGFIPIDEHVTATYDSTGNLLNYHQKPWWQFWG